MQKIVINKCYGGFCLSDKAILALAKLGNKEAKEIKKRYLSKKKCSKVSENSKLFMKNGHGLYDTSRDDPSLIKVIKELGEEANGKYAELKIVEIPDDINWEIDEYDGWERIAEVHSTWG